MNMLWDFLCLSHVRACCLCDTCNGQSSGSLSESPLLPKGYNSNPDGVQKFIPALDSRTTTFTLRPATTEVYSTSPLIRDFPPIYILKSIALGNVPPEEPHLELLSPQPR